jgi:hypothetical protein
VPFDNWQNKAGGQWSEGKSLKINGVDANQPISRPVFPGGSQQANATPQQRHPKRT